MCDVIFGVYTGNMQSNLHPVQSCMQLLCFLKLAVDFCAIFVLSLGRCSQSLTSFCGLFCSGMVGLLPPTPEFKPSSKRQCAVVSPLRRVAFCIIMTTVVRFGEAKNPGPEVNWEQWQLGIFNPSGLNSKLSQVNEMNGTVWLASETHLTAQGLRWFRNGMKAINSKYRYISSGYPCKPKSHTDIGGYSGVAALSMVPLRPLPHSFTPEVFRLSRSQVVGFSIGSLWVQAGIVYGFPDSVQHRERTFQTECILSEVVARVGQQASGPRLIAGDFNHSQDQLQSLQLLHAMGFREVQQVAAQRWGIQPRNTTRGAALIDQIWISVELQALLLEVSVLDMEWADHSSVQCTFAGDSSPLVSQVWRMPKRVVWPSQFQGAVEVNWQEDSTIAYAELWNQLETQAGFQSEQEKGRGQTLETTPINLCKPTCRAARNGDFQPTFYGHSRQHLRWVKQLRRLQAIRRLLASSNQTPLIHLRVVEAWLATRRAPGFPGGFGAWWGHHFPFHCYAACMPIRPPRHSDVQSMIPLMTQKVEELESSLKKGAYQQARSSRQQDLQFVFQDCARDQPEKVDTLIQSCEADIEQVNHADHSIVCFAPVKVDCQLPVIVKGIPHPIIHACHDQVWLTDVQGINVGDTLRQEKVVADDDSILQQFEMLWAGRWNKLHHLDDNRWQVICDFVRATFEPIQWNFPEWTVQSLRSCIKAKKRKAATGPDGVSKQDLGSLPDWALQPFVDLYRTLERDECRWPQQLATGIVSGLAKGTGDGGPDSYRPITVYPLPYRIWGSWRARQAVRSLTAIMPSSIRGGVPNQDAKTVWYQVAQRLESAFISEESTNGLTLDIVKAFNMLPRYPVWTALAQLGMPKAILKTWASFLAQQVRRFRVRCSTSKGVSSCTGYPEGCGLSVLAMIVLDMIVEKWVSYHCRFSADMVFYVDDWQLMFRHVEHFQQLWQIVQTVTHELDIQIDEAKSFVWAALGPDRAALKEHAITCKLAARDLGAHQNYCRKNGNRTVLDRIASMGPTWKLLRASPAPLRAKALAATQLAWPRALHGSSIVKLGKLHFTSLRTGLSRGLRLDKIGANPILQCATFKFELDPEVWTILTTIKDARRLGCRQAMTAALSWLASGDATIPTNGPAAVLASRIARVGWQLQTDGCIQDSFGSFHLFESPFELIRLRMQWAWPRVIAATLSHRKSFQGIQFAHLALAMHSLKAFGDLDQAMLRSAMDGTLYIDLGKSKEQRGQQSQCLHCGASDSFYHRIWVCPAFAKHRLEFPWPSIVPHLPQCLTCHGWPLVSTAWVKLQMYFDNLPVDFLKVTPPLVPTPQIIDLFVDGSCACPRQPQLRFASWAVTMAAPWITQLEHLIIGGGHLTGHVQTSYRAELVAMSYAVSVAAQLPNHVRIWCDNSAVVQLMQKIQKGTFFTGEVSHSDLVDNLFRVTNADFWHRVTVHKVTSHCDIGGGVDELEVWAFWHNKLVDAAASHINFRRDEIFWQLWQNASDSLEFNAKLLQEIQKVLLKVGYADRHLRHAVGCPQLSSQDDTPEVWQPPAAPVPDTRTTQWAVGDGLFKRYGRANVIAIHNWWLQIGVPILRTGREFKWVAGLQLYADFSLETQFKGLLAKNHRQWYETEEEAPPEVPRGLMSRSTRFLQVWGAYLKFNRVAVSKRLTRPSSGALAFWAQCYFVPWPSRRLNAIDAAFLGKHGRQVVKPCQLEVYSSLEVSPDFPLG